MLPILPFGVDLEMDSARVINILGPCTSIDDSVGIGIFWRINGSNPKTSQKRIVLLIGPVEVWHRLATLVDEHECSTQSLLRKTTDVLVHTSFRSCKKPIYLPDGEIGDEPA